ncbi:MAG: nucleotide modification associated domain-containing protein [Candidatus Pacebacteria bacterium]|nr:nucleotide modification associated domain-containing protein [Candidatus Paceibacterota bacterium]
MIKNKKDKQYKDTNIWFDEITKECLDIIDSKKKEYGSSVCRYRPSSITDRILTKLSRIRSIQEKKARLINESIEETVTHTINYVLFRIWRLEEKKDVKVINSLKIKKIISEVKKMMIKKNHDYGESWKKMRVSAIIDEALVKTDRIIKMENFIKKDGRKASQLNPKILDSLFDITNYLIFALIHIKEGKDGMQ